MESKVTEIFGKPMQEQMDEWMDLPNALLQNICKEHNLPVADKHMRNIQTLFAFIK